MAEIHELTMIDLATAIRSGELSPVAVTDHYLRRTAELNNQVGAFYTVTAELAGRMGDEATLISLSAQLEQARPWKDRHPPLW